MKKLHTKQFQQTVLILHAYWESQWWDLNVWKTEPVLFGLLLLLFGFAVYYRGIKVLFLPVHVGRIRFAELRQNAKNGKFSCYYSRCLNICLLFNVHFIHISHNFFAFLHAIYTNLFLNRGWSRRCWKTPAQRFLNDKNMSRLKVNSVTWMSCRSPHVHPDAFFKCKFLTQITISEYSYL